MLNFARASEFGESRGGGWNTVDGKERRLTREDIEMKYNLNSPRAERADPAFLY